MCFGLFMALTYWFDPGGSAPLVVVSLGAAF